MRGVGAVGASDGTDAGPGGTFVTVVEPGVGRGGGSV